MAEDHSYNGWANYETWVVSLWLGNDQGTDSAVRELVADAWKVATVDWDESNRRPLAADRLKDWFEEMFIDPVTESRGTADWLEVAAAFAPDDES